MKKLISIICLLFISVSITGTAHAVSVTPTGASIPTEQKTQSLNDKIDHLKEVLASKVAQLRLVDKRGIIGTVTDVSSTQITLQDKDGNARLIDVDEITKFSSSSATGTFGISDITKGTKLSVLGLYNKESQRILARFVAVEVDPLILSGIITSVDRTNYVITLAQENGKNELIDIENITKTTEYNENLDPTRSGFSKVTTGVRAMVVGYADPKQANRMTASRIILFPSLPKDPKINVSVTAPTPTLLPTTAAKKTTP